MNSLAARLTLAFLVVGLTGSVLVAVFVGRQTRQEFDRFVLRQDQAQLVTRLEELYTEQDGWPAALSTPLGRALLAQAGFRGRGAVVTDAEGRVVIPGVGRSTIRRVPERDLRRAAPVVVDGDTVGHVLFLDPGPPLPRPPPEASFLAELRRALILGAMAATVIALGLGIILARNISQPIRALTEATQAVSGGQLGHQVQIEGTGEIGELASAFNAMSRELERGQRLRRQMTADIAHDLRTPMTVILGYAEGLSEGKFQASQEIYRAMHDEALHLKRLIDDLRTLSLADAGELSLELEVVDPTELLRRSEAAHRQLAEARQVTLRVDAPETLPAMEVDPDRIAQVLRNLVDNALRHTSPEGEVILSAEAHNSSHVRLYVSDTGTGIREADLPHIFERHYRGERARVQDGASGLGLAIARSITEAHGGWIEVDSTVGEGSRFTVNLPIDPLGHQAPTGFSRSR